MDLYLTANCAHRLSAEGWFDLARWSREYRLVNGRERSLFYQVGIQVSRGEKLTPRQVHYLETALRALTRKLLAAGYALEHSPKRDEPLLYRPCPAGHKVQRLSAAECPECGQPFPGPHPEVVGGLFLARVRERDRRRADRRVFHALCECGQGWSWTGAHRGLRQRCPACGRHPVAARYLDGETMVKVAREDFKQLVTDLDIEELELVEEAYMPAAWGPSLLSLLLESLEPPVVCPLAVQAVAYAGEREYWMDVKELLLGSDPGAPRAWAPVPELLERAGVSEEYLEQMVRVLGAGGVPPALCDELEARLKKAFTACARTTD